MKPENIKFYVFYISLAIVATIFLIKFMKNKENNEKYKIIIILSFAALLLHLIKPFFAPYNTEKFPDILRKITFENVCAVSALVYLPIVLLKNKVALDYISTIGLLGGVLAFLYPTEIIDSTFDSMPRAAALGLFSFDTMRFYTVHYLIFIIPFLMLYFKLHTFDLKRAIFLPISVLLMLTLVYVNELILDRIGWLNDVYDYFGKAPHNLSKWEVFHHRDYRNSSFVFGISSTFQSVGVIFDVFVPKFLKTPNYFPVLWITIPAFIYAPLIYLGFSYATDHKKTNTQLKSLFAKNTN